MTKYQPISTCPLELTVTGIQEAVHRGLPPAFVYELHVGTWMVTWARMLMQREFAGTNPLSPHVNVIADPELAHEEWYIESNGVRFGSNPTP